MVSSTLPSVVILRTVVAVVGAVQRVVAVDMWMPWARPNKPSPQERRKLPSRSNTIIGCWPRLNT